MSVVVSWGASRVGREMENERRRVRSHVKISTPHVSNDTSQFQPPALSSSPPFPHRSPFSLLTPLP